ncbi:hypothetical protein GCM10029964_067510 [Kibdelosporangium lantanae]
MSRTIVSLFLALSAVVCVPALPAAADVDVWTGTDLTVGRGAPQVFDRDGLSAYTTDIAGQGPVARIVYRGGDGHLHELAEVRDDWQHADLTITTDTPRAADMPTGFAASGQGRVVYTDTGGHVIQLSVDATGWHPTDLTVETKARPSSNVIAAYHADVPGVGQVDRVVARTTDGHVQEMTWPGGSADLTTTLRAPLATGFTRGSAYVTDLPGQGQVGRVVYATPGGHVVELAADARGWGVTDLTTFTGAPTMSIGLTGYAFDVPGKGPAGHVVYRNSLEQLSELEVVAGGWRAADLPPVPSAAGAVSGYTTNLAGQGPVARVVYRTRAGRIREASYFSGGWHFAELTNTSTPAAAGEAVGYTTTPWPEPDRARRLPDRGGTHRGTQRHALTTAWIPPNRPPEECENPRVGSRAEVFVGRSFELGHLRDLVSQAGRGRGRIVLLSGEPGIGKTRLVDELCRGLDVPVWWGSCWEGPGAPSYWPWVQVLRSCAAGCADVATLPGVAELGNLLSGHAVSLSGMTDTDQSRFLLFDTVVRLLRHAAATGAVLVLDDLQWADASSLLLLRFLTRELRSCPLLVVGAYRDVETDAQHPLSRLVGELNDERAHLSLRGLTAGEVSELVAAVAGHPATEDFTRSVCAETSGNPLYVHEIIRLLGTGDRSVGVPHGVQAVIDRRVGRLADDSVRVLQAAAALGAESETELVCALLDEPYEVVVRGSRRRRPRGWWSTARVRCGSCTR